MWTSTGVALMASSATFWIPAIMFIRWSKRAKKTVLSAEKLQARQAQVQVTAPAEVAEPAAPKGPGIMYRSTVLLFRGIKWTAPRLWAGTRKVSRFTFMVSKAGGKAGTAKWHAYRANKVAQAKAAATPAVSVNPPVDWDKFDQPAFMRVKNASADQHHQIH
ncbi:MAG: hypothetical protein ACYCS8_04975 [Acidithiobacillus sp.]